MKVRHPTLRTLGVQITLSTNLWKFMEFPIAAVLGREGRGCHLLQVTGQLGYSPTNQHRTPPLATTTSAFPFF